MSTNGLPSAMTAAPTTGPITVTVTIADQVMPLAQVTSITQGVGADGTTIALTLPLDAYRQGAQTAEASAPADYMGKTMVVTVRDTGGIVETFRATITRQQEVYDGQTRRLNLMAMDGGGQAANCFLHQFPYRSNQQIFYAAPGILNPTLRGNMSSQRAAWGGGASYGIEPRSGTLWTVYEAINAIQKSAYGAGLNWRIVDGSGQTVISEWDLRGRPAGEIVSGMLDQCQDVTWWWESTTLADGTPTAALRWRPRLSAGSDSPRTLDLTTPWVSSYTLDERGAQTAKEARAIGQPTVWIMTLRHDPANPQTTAFGTTDLIGEWTADDLARTVAGDPTSPGKRRFSIDWSVSLPETGDTGGGTILAGFGTLLPDLPIVRDTGTTIMPGSSPIVITVTDSAGKATCVNGEVGAYIDPEGYLWITGDSWVDTYDNASGITVTLAILSPRAVQVLHDDSATTGSSVCTWSNLQSIRCAGNVTIGVDEDGNPVIVTGDAINAEDSLEELASEAWSVYREADMRLEWSTVEWSTLKVGDWISTVTVPIAGATTRQVDLGRRVLSRSISWDGRSWTMSYVAGARR